MAFRTPLPANTASPVNMPMVPDQKTTPVSMATSVQKMTSGQKRRANLKRKKEGLSAEDNSPITTTRVAKRLVCRSEEEEAAAKQEMMEEKNDDGELSDKIKLSALAKKTEELQGYVNQLQDAVTIGMFQLRDLKKQIAAATTALATTDE
ncbi:hypothetical protein F4782DRAFT_534920 [Xylaria castorea]|nr:hypothetical protein F4782DRAFT_534920 [Xylaria castorea]